MAAELNRRIKVVPAMKKMIKRFRWKISTFQRHLFAINHELKEKMKRFSDFLRPSIKSLSEKVKP